MRYLRYLLLAVIGLVLLVVAMANRAPVQVNLLAADLSAYVGYGWSGQVPLFLLILASAAAGLMIGFVWEWLREHKHRASAASHKREAGQLAREVTRLREDAAQPQDEVLALLEDGKKARAG